MKSVHIVRPTKRLRSFRKAADIQRDMERERYRQQKATRRNRSA